VGLLGLLALELGLLVVVSWCLLYPPLGLLVVVSWCLL
jgi:hypothetical protein